MDKFRLIESLCASQDRYLSVLSEITLYSNMKGLHAEFSIDKPRISGLDVIHGYIEIVVWNHDKTKYVISYIDFDEKIFNVENHLRIKDKEEIEMNKLGFKISAFDQDQCHTLFNNILVGFV